MRSLITFLNVLFFSIICSASLLKNSVPKFYSKLMKAAIEAKDAPAACWYLGMSLGYLKALEHSQNRKASELLSDLKNKEGHCGGKNNLDLSSSFTSLEWTKLSSIQEKIESTAF